MRGSRYVDGTKYYSRQAWLSKYIIDLIYFGLNGNSNGHKIFTTSELKQYTNLESGLYLSILGQVFDVTKGKKHYGPGGNYHAFIGNPKFSYLIFKNVYYITIYRTIYFYRTRRFFSICYRAVWRWKFDRWHFKFVCASS